MLASRPKPKSKVSGIEDKVCSNKYSRVLIRLRGKFTPKANTAEGPKPPPQPHLNECGRELQDVRLRLVAVH